MKCKLYLQKFLKPPATGDRPPALLARAVCTLSLCKFFLSIPLLLLGKASQHSHTACWSLSFPALRIQRVYRILLLPLTTKNKTNHHVC